jgi:dihydrofolate reductase
MSLDGYIAGPGDNLAFLDADPARGRHVHSNGSVPALVWETFYPRIDTLVMGRSTYDKVLTFGDWPYGGKRVIVLSTTLPADLPDVRVVRSLDEAIEALEDERADQVYVDGGRTVQEFLRHGLLEELTVSIVPSVIGGGKRLFEEGAHHDFVVRGSHATPDGLVRITYGVLPS